MSDPNLILKDTGSVEQTNRLVCMYAETIFQHEQTLCPKEARMDVYVNDREMTKMTNL